MLVRFRQDVIELQPKAVIQKGTNDLASVTGPVTEGVMAENFMSMVELAKVHGIRVVLASVLPVCDLLRKQTRRVQGKIIGLNGWLRGYATRKRSGLSGLLRGVGAGPDFKKELTSDGLLPNCWLRRHGYQAEKAIAQALAGSGRKD